MNVPMISPFYGLLDYMFTMVCACCLGPELANCRPGFCKFPSNVGYLIAKKVRLKLEIEEYSRRVS